VRPLRLRLRGGSSTSSGAGCEFLFEEVDGRGEVGESGDMDGDGRVDGSITERAMGKGN
jgi:hypothetical protein